MNIRSIFSFLIGLASLTSYSQNMVPNPGFENPGVSFCGIVQSTNDFTGSMNNWSPISNPDIFSTQVPQNCWNFQQSSTYPGPICLKGPQLPRNGNVFCGIFCYTIANLNQREYIQVQLTSPLAIGNQYEVKFYASLADNTESSISKLGALLSNTALTTNAGGVMSYPPQVMAQGFIADTAAWTAVVDTIIADSAYRYLTIGNFFNDANTPTQMNPGGGMGPGCYGAYYFIDDVSVLDLGSVNSITEEKTGIKNLFVNPVQGSDEIAIGMYLLSEGDAQLEIVNELGQLMYSEKIHLQSGKNDLSIHPQIAGGVYAVRILLKNGSAQKKFVKIN